MPLLKPETRRRLLETDPRWRIKLILRIAASLFAFLAMVMFAAAIPRWQSQFVRVDSVDTGDWTDAIVLGPLVFSLLFNFVSIAYTLSHTRPFPVLITLVLDLLVSLAYVAAIVIATLGGVFWIDGYNSQPVADESGNVDCGLWYNYVTRACSPIFYTIGDLEIAGIVLSFLALCFTFATFVWACKDHARQKHNRRTTQREGTELGIPALRQPIPPPAYEEDPTTVHDGSTKFL